MNNTSKVYIVIGAGLSAESGIPTFRDIGGLWHNHKIDEVCNYDTWESNFSTVHQFYNQRRAELADVAPNAMHLAIAEWQKKYGKDRVINITTNVDDLLERSGVVDVIHLHGDLTKIVNVKTGDVSDIGYNEYDYVSGSKDIKPYVVFFGENAPEYNTLRSIVNFDMRHRDLVIFLGMSFQVVPASNCLPWGLHPNTINVNPDHKTNYEHDFTQTLNVKATESVDILDKTLGKFLSL